MAITKNGVILVDVLQASTLVLLVLSGAFVVVTHLWSRVYLESESFYLARSRLYQNTKTCSANTNLVPESWVNRQYVCNDSSIQVQYDFLPKLLDSKGNFNFSLCESKTVTEE